MANSLSFFTAFFRFGWLSIAIALAFGAIWLLPTFRPNFVRRPGLGLLMAGSAVLTLAAIAFVQIPLQSVAGQAITALFSRDAISKLILLFAIPQIALSGLVQEGAKLIPVIFYAHFTRAKISPRAAIIVGAVSGAGFGIFEAQWVLHSIFAGGWDLTTIRDNGLMAFVGFWERFFAVGFHTAVVGISAWGLAHGWGWRFYLLAALAHTVLNYVVVLLQAGVLSTLGTELYIAVVSLIVFGIAMLLLRKACISEMMISRIQ